MPSDRQQLSLLRLHRQLHLAGAGHIQRPHPPFHDYGTTTSLLHGFNSCGTTQTQPTQASAIIEEAGQYLDQTRDNPRIGVASTLTMPEPSWLRRPGCWMRGGIKCKAFHLQVRF
ncbi:TPA: hypothetical protein ACH3X1_009809 [Trebouxia sp. C0004]